MWKVTLEHGLTLNCSPTLADALAYASKYDGTVVITDGTVEIVGKFGADYIHNNILPSGEKYTWTKRREPC